MESQTDTKKRDYMKELMRKRRAMGKDTYNDNQKTLRAKAKGGLKEEEVSLWKEDLGNVIQLQKLLVKLQAKRPTELSTLLSNYASSSSSLVS